MAKKEVKNPTAFDVKEERSILCDKLNFSSSEAYKLLRTNIMFSLPDEQKCRVLGVTSATRGEGKSTTSINTAYTMAETGKKVLLIEADMRLPNVGKKLGLKVSPGLSNALVGLDDINDCIQNSGILDSWFIITSGDIPPNPSELLGSAQMKELLRSLMDVFDFILIDLPPVNIVTDALVLTDIIDGMMVVTRQGYSTKPQLNEAMRKLSLVDAKVIGIVLNNVDIKSKAYSYKKKYGGGYYSYGYGYGKKHKSE